MNGKFRNERQSNRLDLDPSLTSLGVESLPAMALRGINLGRKRELVAVLPRSPRVDLTTQTHVKWHLPSSQDLPPSPFSYDLPCLFLTFWQLLNTLPSPALSSRPPCGPRTGQQRRPPPPRRFPGHQLRRRLPAGPQSMRTGYVISLWLALFGNPPTTNRITHQDVVAWRRRCWRL